MRIIDADSLLDKVLRHYTEQEKKGNLSFVACEIKQSFADMVNEAPTIEPQRWIPASEPPKSQKAVLVSAKDKTFGYRHTLRAAHIGHHEVTTEDYGWQEYECDTEYDEEKDCFWIPECWYESNVMEVTPAGLLTAIMKSPTGCHFPKHRRRTNHDPKKSTCHG